MPVNAFHHVSGTLYTVMGLFTPVPSPWSGGGGSSGFVPALHFVFRRRVQTLRKLSYLTFLLTYTSSLFTLQNIVTCTGYQIPAVFLQSSYSSGPRRIRLRIFRHAQFRPDFKKNCIRYIPTTVASLGVTTERKIIVAEFTKNCG